MVKSKKKSMDTEKLVMLALLSAIVAVLGYIAGYLKPFGLASLNLTLIPVVIGAAWCGPFAGAWLGGVAGAIFFATPDAVFWLGLSIPGTIITVMVKGVASGLCAGFVYKLLEKYNRYLSVFVSAIVCPVVNTGIFWIGSLIFFMDTVSGGAAVEGVSVGVYLIVFFAGMNFIVELIANIAASPVIVRILDIVKKQLKK